MLPIFASHAIRAAPTIAVTQPQIPDTMNAPTSSAEQAAVAQQPGHQMLHPMVDPKLPERHPPLLIERGDGVYVYDATGKKYLDTVASLWNVNVGHNRPEIRNAIVAQLDKLAYYSTFVNTSNTPAVELTGRLMKMFAPEDMAKVLFSSGGSDAVETAIKLARQYWKLEGQGERVKILSLKLGYHGVHFGGASANGNPLFRVAYEPLMPGFFQLEGPYAYRNPWGASNDEQLLNFSLAELERAIQYQGPSTIAAFLAEPVQGAGGVIVPPPGYWPGVRRILDQYGILLISDEVVTGFGRIGSMCGARAWGVAPDMMAMAKGINSGYVPLGATLVNQRVASAWKREHPLAAVMHGYTYSGHPLACAAANANLDIVQAEDLAGNALAVGAYMLERLREFDRYAMVGDIRGKGLMAALELVKDRSTKQPLMPTEVPSQRLVAIARREGAIVRIQGNRLILSPPLVFTRSHVDETVAILHTAFTQATAA